MHIPDGYLSPGTAGVFYGLMLPAWYAATRKVQRILSVRVLPMMALFSAFCFVIMMLNIPLPGGTTGHAVGASLAAIVMGPWPAVLSISVALVIQALLFGDGGITAIGANCFNMAFVMVWSSYFLYRVLSRNASTPRAHAISAAIAGYVGINLAALCTGIELGLQPHLAHGPDGTPMYAPYPLSVAIPAMMIGHVFAGLAEAVVAGAGVGYILRTSPELMRSANLDAGAIPVASSWRRLRTLWICVGVIVILTPLGLLAPGTAWGEWSADQLREHGLGFVPSGLQRMEGFWGALFSGYSIPGFGPTIGYVLSAIAGVLLIASVFWLLTLLGRRKTHDSVLP